MTPRDISRDLILGFEFQRLVGVGAGRDIEQNTETGPT